MKSKGLKKLCARLALAFTISLGLTTLSSLPAYAAGSFTSVSYNGREYKLYVPSGYTASSDLPLVVMLHGCTQSPEQFAAATQMNTLAEAENFLVMYPKQTSTYNINSCWNFFEPAHQSRGAGEPAVIAGMVNDVKSKYSVDEDKVFATGLSAGGAMTAVLGATYPDVFRAISVGAGIPYKAATSMLAATNVMNNGSVITDPRDLGRKVYAAMGDYARVVPTMVFHGTSDTTVVPKNGDQLITQWAYANDLADDGIENSSIDDVAEQTLSGQVPNGKAYTRYVYNDSNGNTILEKYMITGMGHAWSGGSTAGTYADPSGPNQSEITWNFFKSIDGPTDEDTVAPTTIATPRGGTYPSPVTVTLTADEIATTYYTLDGTNPTAISTKYTSPIVISSDTILKFFSVDPAGNIEAVKTETYVIQSQLIYETANGTAVDHYVAGRLDLNGYLAMGTKYGYVAKFNLYKVQGSTTWTDIKPQQ